MNRPWPCISRLTDLPAEVPEESGQGARVSDGWDGRSIRRMVRGLTGSITELLKFPDQQAEIGADIDILHMDKPDHPFFIDDKDGPLSGSV